MTSEPTKSTISNGVEASADSEQNENDVEPELTPAERKAKKKEENRQKYPDPNPLPEPLNSWRTKLKETWLLPGPEKHPMLAEFFQNTVFNSDNGLNPYTTCLDLMRKSPDYSVAKMQGLAGTILKALIQFLAESERENELANQFLTAEIRKRAFLIFTDKHTSFLEAGMKPYGLLALAEQLLPNIKAFIDANDYRRACTCITLFELHGHFTLNDALLPCYLENYHVYCDTYLKDHNEIARELVLFCDGLIGLTREQVDECFANVAPNAVVRDRGRFEGKTLQKAVARMAKQYSVPEECTPRLAAARSEGSLRYMIHRRFVENLTEAGQNFDDYVQQAVDSRPALISTLLRLLMVNNVEDEALKWACHYTVAYDDLPRRMHERFQRDEYEMELDRAGVFRRFSTEAVGHTSTQTEDLVEPGSLRLSNDLFSQVLIVDNYELLKQCVEAVVGVDLIGMDCEFRPLFVTATEKGSLLQIATFERIFILDLISLENTVTNEQMQWAFEQLLCSSTPRKLGFEFRGDLRVLMNTFPSCKDSLSKPNNVVCIASLVTNLYRQNPEIMAGLATLTGRPTEQQQPVNVLQNLRAQLAARADDSNENVSEDSPSDLAKEKEMENAVVAEDDDEIALAQPVPSTIGDALTELERNVAELNFDDNSNYHASLDDTLDSCVENNSTETQATEDTKTESAPKWPKLQIKLADLCHFLLEKPLDKREQFGNWAKRPLRPSQVHYAALDSYCQLEVYETLKELAAKTDGCDFEAAVTAATLTQAGKDNKVKTVKESKKIKDDDLIEIVKAVNAFTMEDQSYRSVQDVRVAVDSQLRGLGKHLRRIGIDTYIPPSQTTSSEVFKALVEVQHTEKRLIITSGKSLTTLLAKGVPVNQCIVLPSPPPAPKEQLAWLLQTLKLRVTPADIFSICMVCNSEHWVLIPQPHMQTLYCAVVAPRDTFQPRVFSRDIGMTALTGQSSGICADTAAVLDKDAEQWQVPFRVVQRDARHDVAQCNVDIFTGLITECSLNTSNNAASCERSNSISSQPAEPSKPVRVLIDKLPIGQEPHTMSKELLLDDRYFIVCLNCGKVYWPGSHLKGYTASIEKHNIMPQVHLDI